MVCELFTVPKSLVSGRSALRHVVSLTRNTCSDQLNVEDSTIACNREVGVVFRAVEAGHPFIQVIYYVRIPCIIFVFDSQPKSCVDQALKSTADIMCIFLYRLSDGGKRGATFSPVSLISSGEFRIRCHQIFRLYSRPSPGAVFHRLPKLDVLRFFILIWISHSYSMPVLHIFGACYQGNTKNTQSYWPGNHVRWDFTMKLWFHERRSVLHWSGACRHAASNLINFCRMCSSQLFKFANVHTSIRRLLRCPGKWTG